MKDITRPHAKSNVSCRIQKPTTYTECWSEWSAKLHVFPRQMALKITQRTPEHPIISDGGCCFCTVSPFIFHNLSPSMIHPQPYYSGEILPNGFWGIFLRAKLLNSRVWLDGGRMGELSWVRRFWADPILIFCHLVLTDWQKVAVLMQRLSYTTKTILTKIGH